MFYPIFNFYSLPMLLFPESLNLNLCLELNFYRYLMFMIKTKCIILILQHIVNRGGVLRIRIYYSMSTLSVTAMSILSVTAMSKLNVITMSTLSVIVMYMYMLTSKEIDIDKHIAKPINGESIFYTKLITKKCLIMF